MKDEVYLANLSEPELRRIINDSLNELADIINQENLNVNYYLDKIADVEWEREVRYNDFLLTNNQTIQYLPRLPDSTKELK